jgi:hypothetical protein
VFEDELIPLFEKCGKIYDLRLMMDPLSGTNRGYAFVTYTTKEEAERATVEVSIFFRYLPALLNFCTLYNTKTYYFSLMVMKLSLEKILK